MQEDTKPQEPIPSGFDALAESARVDPRMGNAERAYTDDQADVLIQDLTTWKVNTSSGKRPLSWRNIADQIGIAESTLSELRNGHYRGERDKFLRKIDQFLADEQRRSGPMGSQDFASVRITNLINGVVAAGIKHNSMPIVIGPSGCGKSATARAIAIDREGVALIRIDEANGDSRGVTSLLCEALKLPAEKTNRKRLATILEFLGKNRNTVVFVDEAQKLKPDGLEILRDIHDRSDPDGRRNTPIVLFGDADFYRLIVRARSGERSPIKPQMTRRMYPVLNLSAEGTDGTTGGLFSAEDVVRILRNGRMRLVDDKGLRWLTTLANVEGYGSLGFALAVLRMAVDVASKTPLAVSDLQRALQMLVGPRAVKEVDGQAGGQLLQKVG